MRWNLKTKFREMTRNPYFWLLILTTGIAIVIRSIPAWVYTAWGCDSGIYIGIANTVVETAEFFPPYYGWGGSYNEFPILYAVVAGVHWLTGIDVIVLMPKLIPIFGALTVFIFYFIVKELTENKKIAILSALFLSVSAFHVYQLSHAAPLVMGHFFMMLSFYFYIKFRQNIKYLIPLVITTLLLIMSHHFTTYIFIVSLIAIVFFENLYVKEWTSHVKRDIFFTLLASVLTFSYWVLVAKTVFNRFMGTGFKIGAMRLHPVIIIALFYVAFFGSFVLIKYIRKLNIIKKCKEPTVKSSLMKFSLAFFICLSLMIIFAFVDLPGHKITFNPISIVYSIPLLIMFSLVVAGFRQTRLIKNGLFFRGWIVGLVVSFIYSIAGGSSSILPERHPEYISIPMSAIAVLGVGLIFSDPDFKILLSKLRDKRNIFTSFFSKKVVISHKKRIMAASFIVALVVFNGLAIYPAFLSLGPDEGITKEDINTIEWMFENLDVNTTVIASDHRLERHAEKYPYNFSTTGKISDSDKALKIWAAEDLDEYIYELYGKDNGYPHNNYSKITHVLIDSTMKYHCVHVGENYEQQFMTNKTWTGGYDKFSKQPFSLIYGNYSKAKNTATNEPISWAEIYEVNWTYLDEKYPYIP